MLARMHLLSTAIEHENATPALPVSWLMHAIIIVLISNKFLNNMHANLGIFQKVTCKTKEKLYEIYVQGRKINF